MRYYAMVSFAMPTDIESSPLTRVLPFSHPVNACPNRITPAYAGITIKNHFTIHLGKDHPRLRGYYV